MVHRGREMFQERLALDVAPHGHEGCDQDGHGLRLEGAPFHGPPERRGPFPGRADVNIEPRSESRQGDVGEGPLDGDDGQVLYGGPEGGVMGRWQVRGKGGEVGVRRGEVQRGEGGEEMSERGDVVVDVGGTLPCETREREITLRRGREGV